MFGNLQKFCLTKVTSNLTIFIMFLSKGILKLRKYTKLSEIFLNIMKLNWIFIKSILKLPNCKRIFIKFIIKSRNCFKIFSYNCIKLHQLPKRLNYSCFKFHDFQIQVSEYLTLCNRKLIHFFLNLLKSNWISWNSILISWNCNCINLQSLVSENYCRNF